MYWTLIGRIARSARVESPVDRARFAEHAVFQSGRVQGHGLCEQVCIAGHDGMYLSGVGRGKCVGPSIGRALLASLYDELVLPFEVKPMQLLNQPRIPRGGGVVGVHQCGGRGFQRSLAQGGVALS